MFARLERAVKRVVGLKGDNELFERLPPADRQLIEKIRAEKLTYLNDAKLASLATTCRLIDQQALPGIFIEAGCALGGSAILIATVKPAGRPFRVYDVFGMIPPPTAEDTPDVHARYQTIVSGQSTGIEGDRYYGYVENLVDVVTRNIERFGLGLQEHAIELVQGMVQETMRLDQPVAFAHVDVDWYEPVMTCLQRIFPKLTVGGSIILDDYHSWGGCRKATDEYLRSVPGEFRCDDRAGSMKITRVRPRS